MSRQVSRLALIAIAIHLAGCKDSSDDPKKPLWWAETGCYSGSGLARTDRRVALALAGIGDAASLATARKIVAELWASGRHHPGLAQELARMPR